MKLISIDIDFSDIYSENLDDEYKNFHLRMAEIFGFPDFYGKNLAALIDCLSDLRIYGDEEPMVCYSLNKDECVLLNIKNLSKISDSLKGKFLLAIEAVNTRLSTGEMPTILMNLIGE
ncbi:barstar family protein [Eikenella halliae]|uniref:barstar family protein n=1 Tax=Eikenella halliae TaxID=1795832 RepID=UPI0028D51239|nr:barstar family protein [Eikenella halliae]